MALQHYQWLALLTGVVFLTTITSAKKYPVNDAFGERQLRVNVTELPTESEDRMMSLHELVDSSTEWSKSMTNLINAHAVKGSNMDELHKWVAAAEKTDEGASVEEFFALWSTAQKEKILKSFEDVKSVTEVANLKREEIVGLELARQELMYWSKQGKVSNDAIASKMLGIDDDDGKFMLSSWYHDSPKTLRKSGPSDEVLKLLVYKFGYKQLADYAVAETSDLIIAQTADEFFKVLELEKHPDPLISPLLPLWDSSLLKLGKMGDEVLYQTMLTAYNSDVSALISAILHAEGHQDEDLLLTLKKMLLAKQ